MTIDGGINNVYAREVEDVIRSRPAVEDVAVFGVPDEEWAEIVAAAIKVKPGFRLEKDQLEAHCKKALTDYKLLERSSSWSLSRARPQAKSRSLPLRTSSTALEQTTDHPIAKLLSVSEPVRKAFKKQATGLMRSAAVDEQIGTLRQTHSNQHQ